MTVKDVKRTFRIINLVVFIVLLLILALNSFYVIQEQEQAVVITFGKPNVVTTPGVNFKIPFVQDVRKVSMVINGFSIGYADGDYANYTTQSSREDIYQGGRVISSESLMITSDYNFVNVDFFLEYRVSDPERYLFAAKDPEGVLRNLALSYIRDTIGLHEVDEVITTGKNEIQAEIKEKLANRLEQENIGLQLINITIQDAEPPTAEVKNAFKNVETAKQGMETAINNAMKYESEQLPAARAQEDAILKIAEAEKEERISDAIAQVAVFNAMFEEYQKNPMMTRQRMFYETMEDILPNLKIIIDNGDGSGTAKILPLDSFTTAGSATSSGGSSSGSTSSYSGNSSSSTASQAESEDE